MLQADTAQQSDVATANKAAAAARKAAKTTAIVNLHLEELMMEAMIEGDAFFVCVQEIRTHLTWNQSSFVSQQLGTYMN